MSKKNRVLFYLSRGFTFLLIGGVLAGLLSLAAWQFERAKDKQILLDQAAISQPLPPISLNTAPAATFETLPSFRSLIVSGQFLPDTDFLLDNQVTSGALGVKVLTAFQFKDQSGINHTLLVDRGFIETNGARTPPSFTTPRSPLILQGESFIPNHNPFIGETALFEGKHSPWRIQSIRIAAISAVLQTPLLPFVLTLTKGEPGAFLVVPRVVTVITPARHLGYAFTWLALAITWCVLIGLFYHRSRVKK